MIARFGAAFRRIELGQTNGPVLVDVERRGVNPFDNLGTQGRADLPLGGGHVGGDPLDLLSITLGVEVMLAARERGDLAP
jgi:hypothetical protein